MLYSCGIEKKNIMVFMVYLIINVHMASINPVLIWNQPTGDPIVGGQLHGDLHGDL